MTLTKILHYLPRINTAFIIVLFLEFYVFATHNILETPAHEMLQRTSSYRNTSYLTYSIVAVSGHKYHIPEKFERLIPTDSNFTIKKTLLLHLTSAIVCHTIYGDRRYNIGYVNSNGIVQLLLLGSFAASIYNLKYPKQENAKKNMIMLSVLSYFVLAIICLFG